jgi:hypothetical protein
MPHATLTQHMSSMIHHRFKNKSITIMKDSGTPLCLMAAVQCAIVCLLIGIFEEQNANVPIVFSITQAVTSSFYISLRGVRVLPWG